MREVGLFDEEITLTLTDGERRLLMRPITPGVWGGAQRSADLLQRRFRGRDRGSVTDTELSDVYIKAWAYGNGTYQRHYFRPVLRAARRAQWRPDRALAGEVRQRRAELMEQRRRGIQWGTSDAQSAE